MQTKKSKNHRKLQQPDAPMHRDRDADNKEHVKEAHDEAEKDIARDADLSTHSSNDDLDEGEISQLGEDVTDIV
jgi:hypothetical protein